mmetsp:Transcript_40641/g.117357  ORF Transcript_40641/g.117357 Transcript_40641/m.117357 type:complete len:363 (+) Transcript_40641:970-2058(+)
MVLHHRSQHAMGALPPNWGRALRHSVPRGLRCAGRACQEGAGGLRLHPHGVLPRLGRRRLLHAEPDPPGHRRQRSGGQVRVHERAGGAGAAAAGCGGPTVLPPLGGVRVHGSLGGEQRYHALGVLRNLRRGLWNGGHAGGLYEHGAVRARLEVPWRPDLCQRPVQRRLRQHHWHDAALLEMLPAALLPGLALRGHVLLAPLEQRPAHGHGPVHHRGRLRHLVLQGARPEGGVQVHLQLLPLPLWLPRSGELHPCRGPVHQVFPGLHGEAGAGAEEQGHGNGPEVPAVLHVLLREVPEVPDEARVHSDRGHGHPLLHLREECLLPAAQELRPLRRPGASWLGLGAPRLCYHHCRHCGLRILHP